ncbi:hypothetical protein AB0N06_17940 [Streptomyces sp. NPDC051020]|uniref:hypothetical protein n=1 Tax=Streptomyces sp. NPDC051020 TaxID=3155409 RepID=UPI0034331829
MTSEFLYWSEEFASASSGSRGAAPALSLAPESGGTADGSLPPWRPLTGIPSVLVALRYALFADHCTPGAPEDVVPGDRAVAAVGLMWTAPCGPAVAEP